MNRVQLLGRLGSDPELKITAGGQAILKFTLATSETWKDKDTGEKKEKTEWHRCSLFGKRAESLSPYLHKGDQLLVEGSIAYGSYEKDGVKHYTTDIRVGDVHFGAKKNGETRGDSTPPAAPGGDDEIPF